MKNDTVNGVTEQSDGARLKEEERELERARSRTVRRMTVGLAFSLILSGYGLTVYAYLALEPHLRIAGLITLSFVLLLWLGSYFTPWERMPAVGLVGMTILIAAGLYLGLNRLPLALALVLALAGWDLDLFARRLRAAGLIERRMVIRHLRASIVIAGIALGLLLAGLYVRLQLNFGLALLLATVSFASLVLILRLSLSPRRAD